MSNSIRILVVDDESSICDLMKINLEIAGYSVDVAYSAEMALKMDLSGAQNMALTIEAYNDGEDRYEEDTYYHTDIMYYPVTYQGQRMIQIEDFELIGH